MSTQPMARSNSALYPHPFSKAYWKQAAGEFRKTNVLVFAALMIALRVALKPLSIPVGLELRINTAFFINAFGAMVFGPVVAIVAGGITGRARLHAVPVGTVLFAVYPPRDRRFGDLRAVLLPHGGDGGAL